MSPPVQPQPQPQLTLADYVALLKGMNKARQNGYSRRDVEQYLQATYGLGYQDLNTIVKRAPKSKAPAELTTKDMLRLEAYAATMGWLDEIEGLAGAIKGTGYEKARDAARREVERVRRDYPEQALMAMGIGGVAGVLASVTGAGTGLNLLRSGGGVAGAVPSVGVGLTSPGAMALGGAAAGAAAGGGGGAAVPFGGAEATQGMGRMDDAALGLLGGGAAGLIAGGTGGMLAGLPLGKAELAKGILKSTGLGAGGAGGYALLKMLGIIE